MDWYVIHTFSGYENSVKRSLEERIKKNGLEDCFQDIYVPAQKVTERRGKTTVQSQKKLVPGYLFINMELNKQTWHLVQNTPKVTGFLGGQTPRPVRKSEMDRMLGKSEPGSKKAEQAETPIFVNYAIGEQVRVKSGAFANFTGQVEEINQDKQKIWLSVSLFGRPTRVEVDFSEIEAATA